MADAGGLTPEIVLGPPGTGKTTALLGMVEDALARGVPPDRIGYISFTKKAASEAASRACEKFSLAKSDLRWFRTIHSLCYAALGLTSGDVLEGKKMAEFGHWLGYPVSEYVDWSQEGTTFGFQPADRALFMINLARVRDRPLLEQYREDDDGLVWNFVDKVDRGLSEYKRGNHLCDFTDMLSMFMGGDWSPPLEELYVDEAQDLSWLQWQVVWRLAHGCRRVVLAGDDDQAIYAWAGAAVDYFVDLPGTATVLGQSWRCPISVQSLAANIITRVKHRRPKEWLARPEKGELVKVMRPEQADWSGSDILVLVRNAYVAKNFVLPILVRKGIIYEARGHTSVRQTTLEAVVAWEKLRRGDAVLVADARRAYALMSLGKGVTRGFKTLPRMADDAHVSMHDLQKSGGLLTDAIWHQALDMLPPAEVSYLLRALREGEKLREKPRVRVSTIHGAKGGQAEHVVLLTDMAPRTYQEARRLPEDEARVWYVAATRAKQRLTLVAPRSDLAYRLQRLM